MPRKRNTNRRRRRNNRKRNNLPRSLFSLQGQIVRKAIRFNDTITATSSSSSLTFNSNSQTYLPMSNLYNTTDFLNISNNYQCFKVVKILVKVNRIVSEVQLSTVYTNGCTDIFLAFLPTATSSFSSSVVTGCESALKLSPFKQTTATKKYTYPSIIAVGLIGSTSTYVNASKWTPVNLCQYLPGVLQVAQIAPNIAASTTRLFQIDLIFVVEFGYPV